MNGLACSIRRPGPCVQARRSALPGRPAQRSGCRACRDGCGQVASASVPARAAGGGALDPVEPSSAKVQLKNLCAAVRLPVGKSGGKV